MSYLPCCKRLGLQRLEQLRALDALRRRREPQREDLASLDAPRTAALRSKTASAQRPRCAIAVRRAVAPASLRSSASANVGSTRPRQRLDAKAARRRVAFARDGGRRAGRRDVVVSRTTPCRSRARHARRTRRGGIALDDRASGRDSRRTRRLRREQRRLDPSESSELVRRDRASARGPTGRSLRAGRSRRPIAGSSAARSSSTSPPSAPLRRRPPPPGATRPARSWSRRCSCEASSIVVLLCVMKMNCTRLDISLTVSQKRPTLLSSSGASTSSSRQNGAGLSSKIENTSATAVSAFSPPDS